MPVDVDDSVTPRRRRRSPDVSNRFGELRLRTMLTSRRFANRPFDQRHLDRREPDVSHYHPARPTATALQRHRPQRPNVRFRPSRRPNLVTVHAVK